MIAYFSYGGYFSYRGVFVYACPQLHLIVTILWWKSFVPQKISYHAVSTAIYCSRPTSRYGSTAGNPQRHTLKSLHPDQMHFTPTHWRVTAANQRRLTKPQCQSAQLAYTSYFHLSVMQSPLEGSEAGKHRRGQSAIWCSNGLLAEKICRIEVASLHPITK